MGVFDRDLALKIARAVSAEGDIESLAPGLLRLAMEFVPAELGLFAVEEKAGGFRLHASARLDGNLCVAKSQQIPISNDVYPISILRDGSERPVSLVISDVNARLDSRRDTYIRRNTPLSLIYLPLTRRGMLTGFMYLEPGSRLDQREWSTAGNVEMLRSLASALLGDAISNRESPHATALLTEAQRFGHTVSFRWNARSGVLYWSDEAFRILRIDRSVQPTLRQVLDRTCAADVQRVFNAIRTGRATSIGFSVKHRICAANDQLNHLNAVASASFARTGGLESIGATKDLSQNTKIRETLRIETHAKPMSASRSTTMGALAESIAHEVSQPLMAMISDATACQNWLYRKKPHLANARLAAARVVKNGQLAGHVVRSVYQLVKRRQAKLELLSINDIITDTIDLLDWRIDRSNVRTDLKLQQSIPPFMGNRTQIQQLILNLALNGIEAMMTIDKGARVLRIASELNGQHTEVAIEDSGSGIEPKALSQLFEPHLTTKSSGLGLGLSICRSVVDAHGGNILASARTNGTAFVFFLPLAR